MGGHYPESTDFVGTKPTKHKPEFGKQQPESKTKVRMCKAHSSFQNWRSDPGLEEEPLTEEVCVWYSHKARYTSNSEVKKMDFCLRLATAEILKGIEEDTKKNLVFSPFTSNCMLNMVASGSEGDSLRQLLHFLGSADLDDVNTRSSRMIGLARTKTVADEDFGKNQAAKTVADEDSVEEVNQLKERLANLVLCTDEPGTWRWSECSKGLNSDMTDCVVRVRSILLLLLGAHFGGVFFCACPEIWKCCLCRGWV
ncbi:hypothetical protein Tsubulata_001432 [Turnera subulata]|uniref:Serpin domain-containing protein n=1 Tax=Turnera subulata TaxID=218843 RepID=A0A9Q0J5U6_9ROSI|nr:hypothetical protein Tsubulata_001432 [Turnera subulata]